MATLTRGVKVFSTVTNCRTVAFGTDFWPEYRRFSVDPFLVWLRVVSVCPCQRSSLLGFQEFMATNENYQAPFDVDSEPMESDLVDAQQAWIDGELADSESDDAVLSSPFVGRWNELISRTNWEKGHIINQWRQTLIDSGVPSTNYSDEAWARQVGGVTAPHVGRLRRVFDRFGATCKSYPELSWTHFLAAMDWDDAPLWLQGANDGGWSVSALRRQRAETLGLTIDESNIVSSDIDEDFIKLDNRDIAQVPSFTQPGQGGGSTKNYDEQPNGVSSGPVGEGPDFGDEESLNRMSTNTAPSTAESAGEETPAGALVQPFAGLPALPDDLADAIELLKLSIVRHKATGWQAVEVDTVRAYLSAFLILIDARSR
jgi:hypothetical protein